MTKMVTAQQKMTPLKSTSELVEKYTSFKDKEFESIKNFMGGKMTQQQLELEHVYLTKKLKYVSSYLTRLLDKQYLEKQRNEGKSKGARKGLAPAKDTKVHATLVVDAQIENSQRK